MTAETQAYLPGDWIVHRQHGVGQIKGNEALQIGGHKNTYCKIQTHNITYWIPLEKLKPDWLRHLASPTIFQDALLALGRSPRPMDSNPTERTSQINKVKPNNSPMAIARIIRDLSAHNKGKKQVSQTDRNALRYLTDIFLAEWSVCMKLEMDDVKRQLCDMLA
jgi:RNA polymerase-interacting CarD/CdnL/TRCF family regulator